MVENPTPTDFSIIKEPFKTIYDVKPDTPIDDVPKEYFSRYKQVLYDEKAQAEKLQQAIENFSVNPDIEELLMDQAHTTISKFDDHIIRVVFHVGLSTYLKPLNLGLKAESGSGKSYSTVETLNFLPEEDVEEIGSQSPKVISHQNGVRKAKDGRLLTDDEEPKRPLEKDYKDPELGWGDSERKAFAEAKKQYEERKVQWEKDLKECYYEVDLRNKILVFLESVNLETFKMFKTTMSHDQEFIDHKYVDDRGNVHVTRLVGAPAMIFNSVDNAYVEEFATRTLSATPSTRTEKIEESMDISNNKSAYPWLFEKEQFNQKVIKEYIRKIKKFVKDGNIKVAIPFIGIKTGFSKTLTRDMRDFNKFLELLPSYAIFKLFQRPIAMIEGKRYLIPTIQDAIDAKTTFDAILETTKTSTDYRVLEFYNKIVAKQTYGVTAEELADLYNKERKHPLSVGRIREWLRRLEEIGYVDIREATHENDKGYIDRRYNAYYPLKKDDINTTIFKTVIDLEFILQKGFEKWLENVTIQTDPPIIILNIDGTAKPISLEDMKDIVINNKKRVVNNDRYILNTPKSPINQSNDKSTTKPEIVGGNGFSRTIRFKSIPRRPGIICQALDSGSDCGFEAEFDLNGNLYCHRHFHEQVKMVEANGVKVEEEINDV